ncbi:hypothetical protein GTY65_34045 [Streptomyces sp. SID8379]|uniref:hypothetical protein n=1 Tax=unclassified Streptomyces TaxID=2593676 RepID=UPI0003797776|nr:MULTISPECIES: hypothetical protein [unclassified Streptomyces]MYW69059.1 hypothetical protein [Streptomyces sp. SID8379]
MSDFERADTRQAIVHLAAGAGKTRALLAFWEEWRDFGAEEPEGAIASSELMEMRRVEEKLRQLHTHAVEPLPDDLERLSEKHLFMACESHGPTLRDVLEAMSTPLRVDALSCNVKEFRKRWQRDFGLYMDRALKQSRTKNDLFVLLIKEGEFGVEGACGKAESSGGNIYEVRFRERLRCLESLPFVEEPSEVADPYRALRAEVKRYLHRHPLFVLDDALGTEGSLAELEALVHCADSFTTAVDTTGRLSLVFGAFNERYRPEAVDAQCPRCAKPLHTYGAVLVLPGTPAATERRPAAGVASAHRDARRGKRSGRRASQCPLDEEVVWRFPQSHDEFEAGLERAMEVLAGQ